MGIVLRVYNQVISCRMWSEFGFYSGFDRVLSGMFDDISDVGGCENDTGGSI